MALGTNHVTTTTAATFIPEVWSDEIIAAYKKNLVLANLIKKMSFKGKKGDTVHIPSPTRGSASAKTAGNQVNLIAATEGEVVVSINQHYEYSRTITQDPGLPAAQAMLHGIAVKRQPFDIVWIIRSFGLKTRDRMGKDASYSSPGTCHALSIAH